MNPNGSWQTIIDQDATIANDCTYLLGNMCLLTNVNRSLGNANFIEKVNTFRQSDLILTNEIANYPDWNRASIERRQARLAQLATAKWRFDI
jgi:hypothetical protein